MSPINSLWFKWKSLRLPWRKMFLVGSDLSGNTFWEFKDAINAGRFRRIMKHNPKTHYADVQVSPQWHQWLRSVREEAPTIQEQRNDLLRQDRLKHLARIADEKWANKPSYLDRPQEHQPGPATQSHEPARQTEPSTAPDAPGVHSAVGTKGDAGQQGRKGQKEKKEKKENPWEVETGNPGEKWQPEAWTPEASKR